MDEVGTQSDVTRTRTPIIFVCWLLIFFDGYDVVSYGSAVPALLDYDAWAIPASGIGAIGAGTLIGMAIGAASAGSLLRKLGRRTLLVSCLTWFSIAVGIAALAPTPLVFGLFRALAGLGLGCLLPVASALALDYTARKRRTLVYGLTFSAYPFGGIVAGAIGSRLVPHGDFRVTLGVGVVALLIIPLTLRLVPREELPGSPLDPAQKRPLHTGGSAGDLFRERGVTSTVLLWSATFLCLLVIYGLFTWLPAIMRSAGYDIGSAVTFLVVLNVGGVAGMFLMGWSADRVGTRQVATTACLTAALSIGLLSLKPAPAISFGLIAIAGISAIGAQVVINACVAEFFAQRLRATALGWSLGVGRLGAIAGPPLGSVIVTAALPVQWHFYAFGLAAFLAAAALAVVPRQARNTVPAGTTSNPAPNSLPATR